MHKSGNFFFPGIILTAEAVGIQMGIDAMGEWLWDHPHIKAIIYRYLPCNGHVSQDSDSFLERRMGAEQARKHLPGAQRRNNEERRRGRRNIHRDSLVVGAQFLQRANQSIGMPYHAHS